MFAAGQFVYLKTGKHAGRVLECVDGRVYFALPNGVEMDFPLAEMTATPPSGTKPGEAASANLTRVLTMRDITPEHLKILGIIPVRTIQSIIALFERRKGAGRFSKLDAAQKLNFIAEVTEVPYRTMRENSDQPGTLAMMMGRAIAARTAASS